MRLDITFQNEHVLSESNKVNSQTDNVFETAHELKADNQTLKNENIQLREELYELNSKFDSLDSSMRRKSLKYFGIPGNLSETAKETERKTREFLRNSPNDDQSDYVIFYEVRRLKSSDPNKSTVLVIFNRQLECIDIMNLAKEKLCNNPNNYVQNDYSERVRKHGKLLGERMIAERRQGNYSTIRFDKLIINDRIYKYDDDRQTIVCIGKRQFSRRQPPNDPTDVDENSATTDFSLSHPAY